MKIIKNLYRLLALVIVFSMVFALIVTLFFSIYVNKKVDKSIDETLFELIGSDTKTCFYYYKTDSQTGERSAVLMEDTVLYGGYRCQYVEYDRIPDHLKNAFISIEDKRFYSHRGVDWKRTVSAGLNYFLKFQMKTRWDSI